MHPHRFGNPYPSGSCYQRMVAEQLTLFGGPARRGGIEVEPAKLSDEVRTLAARLPSTLYLGTSSWSFPGWRGLVWGGEYSEQTLARRGLAAYVQHPLLRTVGIDRTHYAPIDAAAFRDYASVAPVGFHFLSKAHEACTLAVFPKHPRYGSQRGQTNSLFFDTAYARDRVVAPFAEGLGDSAGPLLFQFAQQPMELLGGSPRRFAEMLYRFLRDLPRGPLYAVEVRNAQLLTADYCAALRAAGAVHCINAVPGMPSPADQPIIEDRPVVIRWLLATQYSYEAAVAAYRPFDRMIDPDARTRRQIARLVVSARARGAATWVIVNNKAEGCAPLSLIELARCLRDDDEDNIPF
jgi:uncharacterized protein YecE (DUF72 family)